MAVNQARKQSKTITGNYFGPGRFVDLVSHRLDFSAFYQDIGRPGELMSVKNLYMLGQPESVPKVSLKSKVSLKLTRGRGLFGLGGWVIENRYPKFWTELRQ